MTLIKLEAVGGKAFWVNPERIAYLSEGSASGRTRIHFSGIESDYAVVELPVEDVAGHIYRTFRRNLS